MTSQPIDLAAALGSFETLWSPRILAQVNDYDVRIAKVAGEHLWHAHTSTDEFFLVLEGELHIGLRDGEPDASGCRAERTVVLTRGTLFVVPAGIEHRPFAPVQTSLLMFEPGGTSSVGDRHDPIPEHVDATTGHVLTGTGDN